MTKFFLQKVVKVFEKVILSCKMTLTPHIFSHHKKNFSSPCFLSISCFSYWVFPETNERKDLQ